MKTMTQLEWNKTPSDYKLINKDGTRQVMVMGENGGVCLEQVIITK